MKIYRYTMGECATNCYLLVADNGDAALIDAPALCDSLLDELEKVQLKKILLTHGHYDHFAVAKQLQERFDGAEICIHEADDIMMRTPECNVSREVCGRPYVISADRLFHDGDEVTVGELTVSVMHTPGHSRGSVCYCVEDIIFTGDTLMRENIGRLDLYGGDEQTMFASIAMIRDLEGDRTLLPGHGPDTTLAHERMANYFMRRRYR